MPSPVHDHDAAQDNWAAMDQTLNGWDHIRDHRDLLGVEDWDLPTFAARVFPGWEATAILRTENVAAIAVAKDHLLLALPIYWPEDSPDPVEGDDLDPTALERPRPRRSWRTGSFDAALTDSVFGTAPMEIVDGLLSADQAVAATEEPRLAVVLAVEAVTVSASEAEQDAIRMLLGLRGFIQPTGYQRLA